MRCGRTAGQILPTLVGGIPPGTWIPHTPRAYRSTGCAEKDQHCAQRLARRSTRASTMHSTMYSATSLYTTLYTTLYTRHDARPGARLCSALYTCTLHEPRRSRRLHTLQRTPSVNAAFVWSRSVRAFLGNQTRPDKEPHPRVLAYRSKVYFTVDRRGD